MREYLRSYEWISFTTMRERCELKPAPNNGFNLRQFTEHPSIIIDSFIIVLAAYFANVRYLQYTKKSAKSLQSLDFKIPIYCTYNK